MSTSVLQLVICTACEGSADRLDNRGLCPLCVQREEHYEARRREQAALDNADLRRSAEEVSAFWKKQPRHHVEPIPFGRHDIPPTDLDPEAGPRMLRRVLLVMVALWVVFIAAYIWRGPLFDSAVGLSSGLRSRAVLFLHGGR